MKRSLVHSVALAAYLLFSVAAHADGFVLTLKNNQFSPKILTIPAGQKIKITVKNQDVTPAEFESSDMNREKVVGPNGEIIIFIGPLDAGSYGYFDDFHRNTTTGTIIAK
ncbi:MAG TPA: cupredoxin domain-containing protein [Rhodocyclaceae bacterium]|nr:cupredoxin domain-containing protein [Rhodocyclaceae bacterium]